MRAVKGNKEYTITEAIQKSYQDAGFDIVDDSGKVIAYGRGKTVTYDEHMKAVKENECLRKLAAEKQSEIDKLKSELEKSEQPKKAEGKKAGE